MACVTEARNHHAINDPEDLRRCGQPHASQGCHAPLRAVERRADCGGGYPADQIADDPRQGTAANAGQPTPAEDVPRKDLATMTAAGGQTSRMAVIDAALIGRGAMLDRLRLWPGRLYLLVLPEHQFDPMRLRDLESDLIVVEMLQPPAGVARIFAALHQLDRKANKAPLDAFLYVGSDCRPEEVDDLLSLGLDGERDLRLEASEGCATSLLLGPGVLHHPSLPLFMSVVKNWQVTDTLFCELLRKYLIERRT